MRFLFSARGSGMTKSQWKILIVGGAPAERELYRRNCTERGV
jgi:hypothetical protein